MTHNADWIDRNEYPFDVHCFGVPAGRKLIRRYNFFATSIKIETYGGYSAIDRQNRDPGEETVSEAMTGRDIRLSGILY